MPAFVLTVLKIVFLAILYFFVFRSVHAVASDMRASGRAAFRAEGRGQPAGGRVAKPADKGRPPRSVVMIGPDGNKGRSHRLDGNIQIGRSDACQVKLDDTYASSFHARIFRRDEGWYVEDLGSTNGTYLNQRRLTAPAELFAGDRVRIGKTVLELKR